MGQKHVSIVQPYLPAYRAPFFEALRGRLAACDVALTVIAGRPTRKLAARGDEVHPPFVVSAPYDRVLGAWGYPRGRGGGRSPRRADLVIAEHSATAWPTYGLALGSHQEAGDGGTRTDIYISGTPPRRGCASLADVSGAPLLRIHKWWG